MISEGEEEGPIGLLPALVGAEQLERNQAQDNHTQARKNPDENPVCALGVGAAFGAGIVRCGSRKNRGHGRGSVTPRGGRGGPRWCNGRR